MAKDFSRDFYNSREWRKARAAKWAACGGLCEMCLAQGLYTPAEIIHHRIPLDENNINDPWTRTSLENLQALCRVHHEEVHGHGAKRYKIMPDGTLKVL